MKKTTLSFTLTICFFYSKSQITLEHTYNNCKSHKEKEKTVLPPLFTYQ